MNLLKELLYPPNLTEGIILSIMLSTLSLLTLWRVYRKKYGFSKNEKITTWILSVLLMIAGTVLINSNIPIITWSFLAFHFSVDRKYMELPDGVNGLIALSAIYTLFVEPISIDFWQGGIPTAITIFILFFLLALLGPMGGGDVKMMAVIGLFFTVWDIPALIFYGFFIGMIQGLYLLIVKKQSKKTEFPFGPALILGVFLFVFLEGGVFVV